MPTQESSLPLSSTIIGSRHISNAFAESVENQEEKGERNISANQDDNGNSDYNTAPPVEGNDNNNGKNENNDGKEREE